MAQANALIPAAESYIDKRTGRKWMTTSPVLDERHVAYGSEVFLDQRPVLSIVAVLAHRGSDADVTVPTTDYSLEDPARGLLRVLGWTNNTLKVTYTVSGLAVPDDLALAATQLVAHWLGEALVDDAGVGSGVKSYSVGGDLSVTYADRPSGVDSVPEGAENLINGYIAASRVFA